MSEATSVVTFTEKPDQWGRPGGDVQSRIGLILGEYGWNGNGPCFWAAEAGWGLGADELEAIAAKLREMRGE